MPEKVLTDLPADVVGHIVARLALAFHVARAAPTCKVVSVAARNAIKVRGFSSEVVTLSRRKFRARGGRRLPRERRGRNLLAAALEADGLARRLDRGGRVDRRRGLRAG